MEKTKVKNPGKVCRSPASRWGRVTRHHLTPSWEYPGRFFSIFRALPTAKGINQPLGPSTGRYDPLGVAMEIDFIWASDARSGCKDM